MQSIAKASQNRSISDLEKVVAEHSQYVSADPIVKVTMYITDTCSTVIPNDFY